MAANALEMPLREACQLTGASWAAWVERKASGWAICAMHNLTVHKRAALLDYLNEQTIHLWLSGALTGARSRSRRVSQKIPLGCARLYVFAEPASLRLLLVGAENLTPTMQRIWRLVAMSTAQALLPEGATVDLNREAFFLGTPSLEHLLEILGQAVPYQGAWLAVRSGDMLDVRARSRCVDCEQWQIPFDSSPLLRRVRQTRAALQVNSLEPEWSLVPRVGVPPSARVWAAVPIVMGQRLIGVLALWRETLFSAREWQLINRLAVQIAPEVEESIIFASIAEHLGRLALLNDFALTVSSALDLEQIAQRVFALLRRSFHTDFISLYLLSSDGATVTHYRHVNGDVVLRTMPWQSISILQALESGNVLRLDDIATSPYRSGYETARSAVFVPLRYRQQVIGALGLESPEPAAFSLHDEHLLVVIASYLAGLVENGRLRQEAELRARNLSLIHDVVQQVIGLNDVQQVAQIAMRLLARNFAYDLAVVMRQREEQGDLEIVGVGGELEGAVREGKEAFQRALNAGLAQRVFVTGQSALVNDTERETLARPVEGWQAGAEMCVPLGDRDKILGVIDVQSRRKDAFTTNDLLVLESLAGVLATVLARVEEYQKLQMAVNQLQAARQELQERVASQRLAETRLIQAAKMAAVGEMAAGIAHELNNPLTTISGFSELILEELPPDSNQRADLELILREARRARDVVRRLLDFARQSESVRVPANVNELIEETLALMKHLLHTSGVEVVRDLAPQLPQISLDRNQIKQVLLNLFHNALHAMPAGGRLSIHTQKRRRDGQAWVTIAVRDTGMGIAPEYLPRVFEPFFTTRAHEGGTGLGLSVSYGIIVDHGGDIEVESEVGKGSCFTVWLPAEAL